MLQSTLLTKTILATKIGDTILRTEDGSLIYVFEDTHYQRNLFGYWLLMYINYKWQIVRFLLKE